MKIGGCMSCQGKVQSECYRWILDSTHMLFREFLRNQTVQPSWDPSLTGYRVDGVAKLMEVLETWAMGKLHSAMI